MAMEMEMEAEAEAEAAVVTTGTTEMVQEASEMAQTER
jgi:hypothetical protein